MERLNSIRALPHNVEACPGDRRGEIGEEGESTLRATGGAGAWLLGAVLGGGGGAGGGACVAWPSWGFLEDPEVAA